MQEAVPVGEGAMAAVLGLDAESVARACAEAAEGQVVTPANLNAPGPGRDRGAHGGGRARGRAREGARGQAGHPAGRERAVPLCVDEAGRGSTGAGAARVDGRPRPRCPSSRTWTPSPSGPPTRRSTRSIRQVSSPVRWEEVVRRLIADGATTFVELGPGTRAGRTDQEDRSEREGHQRGGRSRARRADVARMSAAPDRRAAPRAYDRSCRARRARDGCVPRNRSGDCEAARRAGRPRRRGRARRAMRLAPCRRLPPSGGAAETAALDVGGRGRDRRAHRARRWSATAGSTCWSTTPGSRAIS